MDDDSHECLCVFRCTVRCGSDLGLFGFSGCLVSSDVKQLMVFLIISHNTGCFICLELLKRIFTLRSFCWPSDYWKICYNVIWNSKLVVTEVNCEIMLFAQCKLQSHPLCRTEFIEDHNMISICTIVTSWLETRFMIYWLSELLLQALMSSIDYKWLCEYRFYRFFSLCITS